MMFATSYMAKYLSLNDNNPSVIESEYTGFYRF